MQAISFIYKLKTNYNSLLVLGKVLKIIISNLAPVLPFLMEHFNLKLVELDSNINSIHCKPFLQLDYILDHDAILQTDYLLEILEMIRKMRDNVSVKKPILNAIIKVLPERKNMLSAIQEFIMAETNIINLGLSENKELLESIVDKSGRDIKDLFASIDGRTKDKTSIVDDFNNLINEKNSTLQ